MFQRRVRVRVESQPLHTTAGLAGTQTHTHKWTCTHPHITHRHTLTATHACSCLTLCSISIRPGPRQRKTQMSVRIGERLQGSRELDTVNLLPGARGVIWLTRYIQNTSSLQPYMIKKVGIWPHAGAVAQSEGKGFDSQGPLCGVCMFSNVLQCSPGSPASSHSPKTSS